MSLLDYTNSQNVLKALSSPFPVFGPLLIIFTKPLFPLFCIRHFIDYIYQTLWPQIPEETVRRTWWGTKVRHTGWEQSPDSQSGHVDLYSYHGLGVSTGTTGSGDVKYTRYTFHSLGWRYWFVQNTNQRRMVCIPIRNMQNKWTSVGSCLYIRLIAMFKDKFEANVCGKVIFFLLEQLNV